MPAPPGRTQACRSVVLTHFRADHIATSPSVLRGRPVGAIEVTGLAHRRRGRRVRTRLAARAGLPVRLAVLLRGAAGSSRCTGSFVAPAAGARRLGLTTQAAHVVLLVNHNFAEPLLIMRAQVTPRLRGAGGRAPRRACSRPPTTAAFPQPPPSFVGSVPGSRWCPCGAARLRPSGAGHAAAAGAGGRDHVVVPTGTATSQSCPTTACASSPTALARSRALSRAVHSA